MFDASGGRARIVSIISAGTEEADGTMAFGMELPGAGGRPEGRAAARDGGVTGRPRPRPCADDPAIGQPAMAAATSGRAFVKP